MEGSSGFDLMLVATQRRVQWTSEYRTASESSYSLQDGLLGEEVGRQAFRTKVRELTKTQVRRVLALPSGAQGARGLVFF